MNNANSQFWKRRVKNTSEKTFNYKIRTVKSLLFIVANKFNFPFELLTTQVNDGKN